MVGSKTSVLIVEDDFYARDAMCALVSRDSRHRLWGSVASVEDAATALASRTTPPPDVVLLDVRLAEDDRAGILGIPSIRMASTSSRILVTSVMRDEDTILAALEAGADGYVWKNESASGIGEAIARVAEGRFVVTPSIATLMLGAAHSVRALATEVLRDPAAGIRLSEAVRKVLYLYCMCGMSAKEIAEELQLSVNTVNSHIRAAYAALGAGTRQEAFQRLVEAEGA